jgi:hypothetical protein
MKKTAFIGSLLFILILQGNKRCYNTRYNWEVLYSIVVLQENKTIESYKNTISQLYSIVVLQENKTYCRIAHFIFSFTLL